MSKQKKGPAFLLKTYDMLQKEQFKEIIDWTAQGTGFVVKNPTQLSQKVLPKYFKHSNMHSFIRQLNMYGFNKKRGSKVQNYYFHAMFKKGDRETISHIHRKAEKKGLNREEIREGQKQDVSIELQENSHSLNKTNNKMQVSESNVQDHKRQIYVDDSKMLKTATQLNDMNKILLLEQIYHLANISSNNLLTYCINKQCEAQTLQGKDLEGSKSVIDKFIQTKDRYVKIMAMVWDRVNGQFQKYESQTEKNMSFCQIQNENKIQNQIQKEKHIKQTQISIQKLSSKILAGDQPKQIQKSFDQQINLKE